MIPVGFYEKKNYKKKKGGEEAFWKMKHSPLLQRKIST
jgi:hypothetical protein